jgi:hypothetical protein
VPSKFYADISEDERKEWRQHPTTILALAMLAEFREEAADDVLTSSEGAPDTTVRGRIGFHRGIKETIELLERE